VDGRWFAKSVNNSLKKKRFKYNNCFKKKKKT